MTTCPDAKNMNTSSFDQHSDGNSDATRVIPDQSRSTVADSTLSDGGGIIEEAWHQFTDLQLDVDVSTEFRRQLENTGNRYQIIKLISEGGFGRIFLARDRVLGRTVVVKSLKDDARKHPDRVARFIAEAKLNSQLDHPAIVPIYSLDTDNQDGLHLAMQLVDGITLKEYLLRCREKLTGRKLARRWERSLRQRLEGFLRVCDAIEYCHSRGIIHCDLKPENIMLGRHGEVYVMDWGIACPVGSNRKGHLEGTPAYLAPEMLRDGKTTEQTDVFALGMILNEVATLRGPITDADYHKIIARVQAGDFEPSTPVLSKIRLAPALRAIIEKARSLDPAERYSNVKALSADLRRYLFDEEVSACPDTPMQKTMRFLHRHRYATLLTLAIIICLLAGTALYGVIQQRNLVAKVNLEMMRRLKVQLITEKLGSEIDYRLRRIGDQLQSLATSFLIEQTAPERGSDPGTFYLSDDFAPGAANRPKHLLATHFYRREISFYDAAYFQPAKRPRSALMPLVRQLRSSRRQGLTMICDSLENDVETATITTPDELGRNFMNHGALLRRIVYLMDDGTAMRYPGMYEPEFSPTVFLTRWPRETREHPADGVHWTLPYNDASGCAVIACCRRLYRPDGLPTGWVGFELSYDTLIAPLLRHAKAEGFRTKYFLVSPEGLQLFSSDDDTWRKNNRPQVAGHPIELKKFAYPKWLKQFDDTGYPQIIRRDRDGRLIRVSATKIPQTDWTLIRTVQLDSPDDWIDPVQNRHIRRRIEAELSFEADAE